MTAIDTLTTTPSARRPSPRPHVGSHAFLLVLTCAFLAPVAWAVLSSFKPAAEIIRNPLGFDPGTLTLANFAGMVQDVPIGSGFLNTGIVLAVKGSVTLFCAPLAAYAFASTASAART